MDGPWDTKDRAALGANRQAAVNDNHIHEGDERDAEQDDDLDSDEKKKFLVDYCKKGATRCRRCKKNIQKDSLRIGKPVKFKAKHIYITTFMSIVHLKPSQKQDPRSIQLPVWTISMVLNSLKTRRG